MTNTGVTLLTKKHFDEFPLWKFNDDGDVYLPVSNPDELPEDIRDLRVKAEFLTPAGVVLDGYIVCAEKVFSIGVFYQEQTAQHL